MKNPVERKFPAWEPTTNPYSPPSTPVVRPGTQSGWARHRLYSALFVPIWFFVGGAFSISGSHSGILIDSLGMLAGAVYLLVAWIGGLFARDDLKRR